MSVFQAASQGYRDMADDSVRITFEFEPRHAAEAVRLFGKRGTACAVAALTQAAALQSAQQETIKAEKPGPLCVLACQWCKDPEFWRFIEKQDIGNAVKNESDAKTWILYMCGIASRRELDESLLAADLFHRYVREPFMCWRAE